jgi:ketosteroid isomerase-like protein
MSAQQDQQPVEMVEALYAAIRDGRVEDVIALTHPNVVCQPLVRPGLSVYHGHERMGELVADMHAVHGEYTVVIDELIDEGAKVTAEARIMSPGKLPQPVRSIYTFRDGLIATIESEPGSAAP